MAQNETPEPNKGLTMLLTCGIMVPVFFVIVIVGVSLFKSNAALMAPVALVAVIVVNQGVKAFLKRRMKPQQ
jgi:hypothetical protein